MASIGLFYGSSTCYTEMAAEKIQVALSEHDVQLFNVADTSLSEANRFDYLILGIPTWDYGELQEDWENVWDDLDTIEFPNKTVALFGLGDAIGYPEWFLDALGYLHAKVSSLGAKMIGYTANEGFVYEQSQALTDDKTQFVGLALDDENQFDQTDNRIHQWCRSISSSFL